MRFDHGDIRTNLNALKGADKTMTTARLAEAAGIHPNSMSRFLCGGSGLQFDKFEEMLRALGVRVVLVVDEPAPAQP